MRELSQKLEQAIRLGMPSTRSSRSGSRRCSRAAISILSSRGVAVSAAPASHGPAAATRGQPAGHPRHRAHHPQQQGTGARRQPRVNVTLSALQVGATVAHRAGQPARRDRKGRIGEQDHQRPHHRHRGAPAYARRANPQQAASAQLDIEGLKSAFVNIRAAMEDIASFRQDALPKMAQSVLELDRLSSEAGETIRKLDRGNQARPRLNIDVE